MKKFEYKFSIIIPTYNRSAYIDNAILSILNQEYSNWELLIIDNYSEDETVDKAKAYIDDRIKIVVNDKNYERCYSRNKGIDLAQGDFILFLDSDDYFEKDHLKNWQKIISTNLNNTHFFICNKKIFNQFQSSYSSSTIDPNELIKPNFFLDNIILPGQVCLSKDLISKFRFNSEYLIFEDTALWLQISNNFNFEVVNFDSFVYVIHEKNSVNFHNSNFGKIRIRSLMNFIKNNKIIVQSVGRKWFRKECSLTLFLIAKYYISKNKRLFALYYLLKSLFLFPAKYQLKHRIYILYTILVGRKNVEYNSPQI